ncbi:muraminidase [filamentous cyanobacterium CCP5]|nr:muraminidase [filamentous cyanobacterium CCP5]
MGTWIKETDKAIYLMQGGYWISRLSKYPSKTNPNEQVLNISAIRSWFTREDYPRAMTVSIGTGAPEPEPLPAPAVPAEPATPTVPTPSAPGTINAAGLELIKHFEGVRYKAYRDSVGVWTIGYGHTSMAGPPQVYEGLTITPQQAEEILKRDLGRFEKGVTDAVTISINPNQFAALVSFAFNLGVGALQNSTLLSKLNAGDYQGAANEFPRWVYAGGNQLPGLVRRRNAERALFLGQNHKQFM